MKRDKKIYLFLFLFLVVFSMSAQKQIHGKITAFGTYPIANAEIIVRKTQRIVLSNSMGGFSIECLENDKLVLSANGFKSKLVKVKNLKDSINVNLLFGGNESDRDDAIESGHIQRSEMMLAFKNYEAEKLDNSNYESIPRMIEIKFPRVTLVNDVFQIRGKVSINGNTSVLIFVNGVASTMNAIMNMAVDEVSNIEVLTGGETTPYGGGANGVILITTKVN